MNQDNESSNSDLLPWLHQTKVLPVLHPNYIQQQIVISNTVSPPLDFEQSLYHRSRSWTFDLYLPTKCRQQSSESKINNHSLYDTNKYCVFLSDSSIDSSLLLEIANDSKFNRF